MQSNAGTARLFGNWLNGKATGAVWNPAYTFIGRLARFSLLHANGISNDKTWIKTHSKLTD